MSTYNIMSLIEDCPVADLIESLDDEIMQRGFLRNIDEFMRRVDKEGISNSSIKQKTIIDIDDFVGQLEKIVSIKNIQIMDYILLKGLHYIAYKMLLDDKSTKKCKLVSRKILAYIYVINQAYGTFNIE